MCILQGFPGEVQEHSTPTVFNSQLEPQQASFLHWRSDPQSSSSSTTLLPCSNGVAFQKASVCSPDRFPLPWLMRFKELPWLQLQCCFPAYTEFLHVRHAKVMAQLVSSNHCKMKETLFDAFTNCWPKMRVAYSWVSSQTKYIRKTLAHKEMPRIMWQTEIKMSTSTHWNWQVVDYVLKSFPWFQISAPIKEAWRASCG